MYLIKKVINNNAMQVIDSRMQEYVLLGLGIGFDMAENLYIEDNDKIEKKFLLEKNRDSESIVKLIESVSFDLFKLNDQIIDIIQKYFSIEYSGYNYYNLLDHVTGCITRAENGIKLQSNLSKEDKIVYELELIASDQIVRLIEDFTKVSIEVEEVFIFAIHLNHAQNDLSFANMSEDTSIIIKRIIAIVKLHFTIDDSNYFFRRFILHLKYFTSRQLEKIVSEQNAGNLYLNLIEEYPIHAKCVAEICNYLELENGWMITTDERFYLLLHIIKLGK